MAKELPDALANFDWSLTTWEGSRREQMRRWAALPLETIIAAIEEMEEISRQLNPDVSRVIDPRQRNNA
jgi:hypothetical protein